MLYHLHNYVLDHEHANRASIYQTKKVFLSSEKLCDLSNANCREQQSILSDHLLWSHQLLRQTINNHMLTITKHIHLLQCTFNNSFNWFCTESISKRYYYIFAIQLITTVGSHAILFLIFLYGQTQCICIYCYVNIGNIPEWQQHCQWLTDINTCHDTNIMIVQRNLAIVNMHIFCKEQLKSKPIETVHRCNVHGTLQSED